MDEARWEAMIERMDRREVERDARFLERMRSSERHFIEALAENSAEIRKLSRELTEGNRRIWKSIDDMRESIQANTRAVLAVLDRMDRLGGGSAA